jgi:hypothetical protein
MNRALGIDASSRQRSQQHLQLHSLIKKMNDDYEKQQKVQRMLDLRQKRWRSKANVNTSTIEETEDNSLVESSPRLQTDYSTQQ